MKPSIVLEPNGDDNVGTGQELQNTAEREEELLIVVRGGVPDMPCHVDGKE